MAKKITGYIKLQIPAGKANPAPPIGPALGSARREHHGVLQGVQRQDAQMDPDLKIPVVITVYADRSFTFETKTPPAADLVKEGGGNREGIGKAEPGKGRYDLSSEDRRDRQRLNCRI